MLLLNYQIVSYVMVELKFLSSVSDKNVLRFSSSLNIKFSTGMPLKHYKGFFEYWQAFKHSCTFLAMVSMFSLCSLLPVDEVLCTKWLSKGPCRDNAKFRMYSFNKIPLRMVFSKWHLNNFFSLRNFNSLTKSICTNGLESCSDGPLSTTNINIPWTLHHSCHKCILQASDLQAGPPPDGPWGRTRCWTRW